jgi:hypothetical protein
MKTNLASAFGLAMLSGAFSFSTSFACPETSQTTASALESTVSGSGMNVTALAEASAPEGQVGERGAPDVVGNTEAPSFANAIPVEITETVTVVVPGQNSEDEEGPAIAGTEPSVIEASPEVKSTADLSVQTGTAEADIFARPAATIAPVELPSTDVNAPPTIVSVDPVEITVTVTVVVPGQTPEEIEEVDITGAKPEYPTPAPNRKRDEATAALDDGE